MTTTSGDHPARPDPATAMADFSDLRHRTFPPPNQIPGVLPLRHVLGRTGSVVALLADVHAYSAGLHVRLTFWGRGRHPVDRPPFLASDLMTAELMGVPVAPPPELSLTLADGSTVVGLDRRAAVERVRLGTDVHILCKADGRGSNDRLDASWWLTPHPHCAVTLDFAWPAQGLAATSLTIGADELETATSAAETLWPWEPADDLGGRPDRGR